MSFNTTFKNLRRKSGLTQEDIANALSVTPQAVSRWECGSAMPDISLIPQIAYLFGVTSDHLLGIDITRMDEEVEEIIKSTYAANNTGNKEEVVRLYREGLKKFPNNYKLMNNLAAELYMSFGHTENEERRSKYAEACSLCEHILATCTDSGIRNETTSTYIYILGTGEEYGYNRDARKKAMTLIETMPSKYSCREEMLLHLMTREEAFEQRKKNAYDFFFHDLPFYMLYMEENPHYTLPEAIHDRDARR